MFYFYHLSSPFYIHLYNWKPKECNYQTKQNIEIEFSGNKLFELQKKFKLLIENIKSGNKRECDNNVFVPSL